MTFTAEDLLRVRSGGYNPPLADHEIATLREALLIAERVMTPGVLEAAYREAARSERAPITNRAQTIRDHLTQTAPPNQPQTDKDAAR